MKTLFKSFSSLQCFSSVCFLPSQGPFSGFMTIGLLGRTIYIKTMHCFSELGIWIRPHRVQGSHPQGLVLKGGSGDICNRERGCSQIDTLPLAVCSRKKQKVLQNGVPIHCIKKQLSFVGTRNWPHLGTRTNSQPYREGGRERKTGS